MYAAFYLWYGGSTAPLSETEVAGFVATAGARDPQLAAPIRAFAESDDGGEFVMVNLNQYRERAEYADGREATEAPRKIEQRYTSRMVWRLFARACHPIAMVEPIFHLGSGDAERHAWDRATMVRYRSRRDFLELILSPAFEADVAHKWAALERTHSFPSTPRISAVTFRLVPFLLLVVAGLLLDRFSSRSR